MPCPVFTSNSFTGDSPGSSPWKTLPPTSSGLITQNTLPAFGTALPPLNPNILADTVQTAAKPVLPLISKTGKNAWTGLRESFGRFGEGVVGSLVSPFQKISEDLLYGFLAVDEGMELCRMTYSLIRGRKPYDATQDPDFTPGQNELQQVKEIGHGFYKGLNMPFFIEEFYRGLLVGPIWLAGAAALFGGFRATMGNGLRMSVGSATQLSHTLMDHMHYFRPDISPHKTGQPVTPTGYLQELKPFLGNLVHDKTLKASLNHRPNKPLERWVNAWTQSIEDGMAYRKTRSQLLRTQEAICDWGKNVLQGRAGKPNPETIQHAGPGSLGHYQHSLNQLAAAETHLNEAILNHQHFNHPIREGKVIYDEVNKLAVTVQKRVKNGLKQTVITPKITQFLHEMNLFRDITMSALEKHLEAPRTGTLAQHIERQLERVVGQKLFASIVATGLLFYYTRALTERLQSHKTYPGNDNRRMSDISKYDNPRLNTGVKIA